MTVAVTNETASRLGARVRPIVSFLVVLAFPASLAGQSLRVVGQTDLGGEGLNGDVTVVGSTAVVAAGLMPAAGVHAHLYNPYPCPAVSVKLVDLSRPETPVVVGRIPVSAGLAAHGVAAARVATSFFNGDLLAVAMTVCGTGGSVVERGIEYYDISRPSAPVLLGRYRADSDIAHADSVPPCGAPPARSAARCASSQHSVSLVQRPDGSVYSLSLEPGASASKYPSGDLRIVDVTNPRKPVQVGSFPPAGTPIFSNNGCRPFTAGHGAGFSHNGNRGLLAFYDGGLFVLDLPRSGAPAMLGQFTYPVDRGLEGSAAYVASARVNGRDLALISEADFVGPTTTLEVGGPTAVAGSKFGCEALFTLYDKENKSQLYRQPGFKVQGELAYVGRACPRRNTAVTGMHGETAALHDSVTAADPYLSEVAGRIAIIDRSRQPLQSSLRDAACSVAQRVRLAQQGGARAVVFLQTSAAAPQAFSPDGEPEGITIPVIMIDKRDGDALRTVLCPALENGRCTGAPRISATLRASPGEWGALRVVDVTEPRSPRELGVYRTPRSKIFPPEDLSVFSPQRAAVHGDVAVVPWNSDGVRVIDISSGAPREIAAFVPPDVADPTGVLPVKAFLVSVALLHEPTADGRALPPRYILASDVNSGLYVLSVPWPIGQASFKAAQ